MFKVINPYRLLVKEYELYEGNRKKVYMIKRLSPGKEGNTFVLHLKAKDYAEVKQISLREIVRDNRWRVNGQTVGEYLDSIYKEYEKAINKIKLVDITKLSTAEFSFQEVEGDQRIIFVVNNIKLSLQIDHIVLTLKRKIGRGVKRVSLREIWESKKWSVSDRTVNRYLNDIFSEDISIGIDFNPSLDNILERLLEEKKLSPTPKNIYSELRRLLEEDRSCWMDVPTKSSPIQRSLTLVKVKENKFLEILMDTYFYVMRQEQREIDFKPYLCSAVASYCNKHFQSLIDEDISKQFMSQNITGKVSAIILNGEQGYPSLYIKGDNKKADIFIPFPALKISGGKDTVRYVLDICFEIFPCPKGFNLTSKLLKSCKKLFSEIKYGLDDFFSDKAMSVQGMWAPRIIFKSIAELVDWLNKNISTLYGLWVLANSYEDIVKKLQGAKQQIDERVIDIIDKRIDQFDLQRLKLFSTLIKKTETRVNERFKEKLIERVKQEFNSSQFLPPSIAREWIELAESYFDHKNSIEIIKLIMEKQVRPCIKRADDTYYSSIAQEWIIFLRELVEKEAFRWLKGHYDFILLCVDTFRPLEDIEDAPSIPLAEKCLDFLADLSFSDLFNILKGLKLPRGIPLCSISEYRSAGFACFSLKTSNEERDRKINACMISLFEKVLPDPELLENWVNVRNKLWRLGVKIKRQ